MNELDNKEFFGYRELAYRACCRDCCLTTKVKNPEGSIEKSIQVVRECQIQLEGKDYRERKSWILQKIDQCCTGKNDESGYMGFNWAIGRAANGTRVEGICRVAFANAYNISTATLSRYASELKKDILVSEAPVSDDTNIEFEFRQEMLKLADCFNLDLSNEQLAGVFMPNKDVVLYAYAWMAAYFNGFNHEPNRDGIINIPHEDKRTVWLEYVKIVTEEGEPHLEERQFNRYWQILFPYVKPRAIYGVMGHCEFCANINDMKGKSTNKYAKARLHGLFGLHKATFMGEKQCYYHRIRLAKNYPEEYASFILDGMQQAHSVLPWLAHDCNFASPLPQHCQGVIEHGKAMRIFRTFHTISNDGNLAIHAMLTSIEERWKLCKSLDQQMPHVLFLQIDGGTENVTKITLLICELLIIKGICDKIILSRLMVGHTHEDIDSKFGRMWRRMRGKSLRTAQEYEAAIKTSLKHPTETPHVHDVYCVPNYDQLLRPCLDPNFGNYAKEINTKHAFRFEKVQRSAAFPLGVRVYWRKYSADAAIEIGPDSSEKLVGLSAWEVISKWEPEAERQLDEEGNVVSQTPGGMYLMWHLPTEPLRPAPLIKGSYLELMEVYTKVKTAWTTSSGIYDKYLEDWEKFVNTCPKSDNVEEFIKDNPHLYHIPFKRILFKDNVPQDDDNDSGGDGDDGSGDAGSGDDDFLVRDALRYTPSREELPLVKGRLKVKKNVYWSNRFIQSGGNAITYKDRVDQFEVECLYDNNGKEVAATADDVLALQRDYLEQKKIRRENNAKLKRTKEAHLTNLAEIRKRVGEEDGSTANEKQTRKRKNMQRPSRKGGVQDDNAEDMHADSPAPVIAKKTPLAAASSHQRKKNKRKHSDDDDDNGISEEEEREEEEEEGDDDEEEENGADTYDLSQYLLLKGTIHYDNDDDAVFKVADVRAEDFDDGKGVVVVVYRSKFNERTKKWEKVNENDPIMVADIIKYNNSDENKVEKVLRLQGVSANTTSNIPKPKPSQRKK